jgi:TolB protein
MRVTLYFLLGLIIALCLNTCNNNPVNDDESPCGYIDPLIIPQPPYSSPIWHPGGQFIGFNHTPLKRITYPYGEECWGEQEFDTDSAGFWLVNHDGTNKHRIFPYTLQSPAWSPDGEWISFVLGAQIFKMKFTGTGFDTSSCVQLTLTGRNFFPAWSPDGQWMAYDSDRDDPIGANVIWKMRLDGSDQTDISQHGIGEWRMPDWAPDGKHIVHQRYINAGAPEIVVMDTAGGNSIRLTYDERFDKYPRYSPDGTKIAFVSHSPLTGINIWIMVTDGSSLQQVTSNGVDADMGIPFSWSPIGEKLVYTRYRPDDWTMNNGVLWMMDIISGDNTQLSFNP